MSNLKSGEFLKSLNSLQSFAKGSQLFHTGADSDPKAWPGGAQRPLDELGSDIGINDNGTDYDGVRQSLAGKIKKSQALTPAEVAIAEGSNPLPAIQAKISKGMQLTPAEDWAIKGGFDAASGKYLSKASTVPIDKPGPSGEEDDAKSVPASNAGGEEEDVEPDAKKSLDQAIGRSLELQKGFDTAPVLYEFANAIGHALNGSEDRVVKSLSDALSSLTARIGDIEKSQQAAAAAQDTFNKSLAGAVVGIGESVSVSADESARQARMPVGPPMSQLGAAPSPMAKSQPIGGGMQFSKAAVSEALFELAKSGHVKALEVSKHEVTGNISPESMQKVETFLSGNR
ncbi:MAG: hypothetical protein L3J47_00530 [Sulfurovum sp.]|nr:hypothetical protein [Sulfurovum sp.]